ncbi:MAG: PKD domain-containing protein [Chitinophagaceae bacterium]
MRKIYGLLAGLMIMLASLPANATPQTPDAADFTFTINPSTNNAVFVNHSTIGNEPGTRRAFWSFGDGSGLWTGGMDGAEHHYASAGTYTVCLKIYRIRPNINDTVLMSQVCKTLVIESVCHANFESPAVSPTAPAKYFIAQPSHNQNKKPLKICWTFGDNRDTCIQYNTAYTGTYSVSHLYGQPGTYNVCVKIFYDGGCEAQNCHSITVQAPGDSCKADYERIPAANTNDILWTSFRALPWNSSNKKPSKICWTFGDNKDTCINYGQDYTGPYVVNHHYQQPGQYEVCVKINYYGGCEARTCKTVLIPNRPCSVGIIQLTPSSSVSRERLFYSFPHSASNSSYERICWTFGDGTDTCILSTAAAAPSTMVRHTYPGAGVYRTCVKVFFRGGCIAEECTEVVIKSNTQLCGGYMTDSLISPQTIKFKAFAINNPADPVVSFGWTFGDGSSGQGQEITHTYTTGGEHRVCLTILTQSRCETKICNTVKVNLANQPVLQLSPNPALNVLHASFLSAYTENVTIKIINSNGTAVRTYTRSMITGVNNWDIDLSGLLPGPYLLTIQSPRQMVGLVFVKQ